MVGKHDAFTSIRLRDDESEMNIESATDVVDVERDQIVFNEVIPGGQLFLPVTATAEAQFLITLRYL